MFRIIGRSCRRVGGCTLLHCTTLESTLGVERIVQYGPAGVRDSLAYSEGLDMLAKTGSFRDGAPLEPTRAETAWTQEDEIMAMASLVSEVRIFAEEVLDGEANC